MISQPFPPALADSLTRLSARMAVFFHKKKPCQINGKAQTLMFTKKLSYNQFADFVDRIRFYADNINPRLQVADVEF